MKKLCLFATIALLFSGIVSAQDETKMWVGGSLSIYNHINTNGPIDVTTSSFTLAPEFGINLTSQWAVGGRLGITSESKKGYYVHETSGALINTKTSSNSTSLVPFARYTIGSAGGFSFFGQGELPIVFGDAPNTVGLKVLPGITYSLGSFGIQALLPSILAFESGDGVTSMSLKANTNYLNGTSIGLIYKF